MQGILSTFGHIQIVSISICVSTLSLFSNKCGLTLFQITVSTTSFAGGKMQKWLIWEEDSYQNLQTQVVNKETAHESTPSPAIHWITAGVYVEMCVCEAECRSLKA